MELAKSAFGIADCFALKVHARFVVLCSALMMSMAADHASGQTSAVFSSDRHASTFAMASRDSTLLKSGRAIPLDRKEKRRGMLPRPVSQSGYNKDGSRKYSFEGGGGFTAPVGQTASTFAPGFRFQGGVGRAFDRRASLLLQFDWDGLSVKNSVLGQLLPVYQTACGDACTGGPIAEVFGSHHIWSFSLNPVVNFVKHERRGVYATGGIGFFHKVTRFTAPAATSSCDGCAQSPTFGRLDEYTSNAPGVNVGLGVTQVIGSSEARFYAETRFVHVFNQERPYSIAEYGHNFNAFPANSQSTSYLPVTFGVRW